MDDKRYDYVTCATCGKRWQWIDFGCVAHAYFCAEPKVSAADMKAALADIAQRELPEALKARWARASR